jgi:uncharacterized protein (UPF0261 family)
MKKVIALVGTLDTKGPEINFVKNIIDGRGHHATIIDIGVLGNVKLRGTITSDEVARAGGSTIEELIKKGDENEAGMVMAKGLKSIVLDMAKRKKIHGLLAMGGGQGSITVSSTLQALPLGFPKILVSTKVTQAGAAPFAGSRDVTLVPSVADLAGLNRLTRHILANAAGAIVGMVETEIKESEIKPLVVMSMNGTVTRSGLFVKDALEKEGYEVLVFHSIGTGGKSLEDYVSSQKVDAVIEFAVNELGNELFGGMASAGPNRFEAAGFRGIPQIIIPGSADFINFLSPSTVPKKLARRLIHYHNPQATLIRTNISENRQLGEALAEKLNRSRGRVFVLWPKNGLSSVDVLNKKFFDPKADAALYHSLIKNLKKEIPVLVVESDVNSPIFAKEVIKAFQAMTWGSSRKSSRDSKHSDRMAFLRDESS